jgi:hypothetical protein
MQRPALWTVAILGAAVALGVCVQVYLISAYFFGADDALDAHSTVGNLVHGLQALVFVAALVAWWRRWAVVGAAFGLLVLGTVQVGLSDGDTWVGALHGLLALAVLGLAGVIHAVALREARGRAPAGTPAH